MTPAEFVTAYLPAAVENERRMGVPWQVTLAQAALESGWGKHAPGNNFFGIKADPSWTGARQTLRTREVVKGIPIWINDEFRAYDSALESFVDHAAFLKKWSRYAAAFLTKDPREFARRIAAGGYATDPNYAGLLIKLIGEIERHAAVPTSAVYVSPDFVPKRPSLWARFLNWLKGS